MPSALTLRRPREDEEEEFLRAHRSTSPEVPSFLHYYTEGMPFRRIPRCSRSRSRASTFPRTHVPSTFLFAFVGARIVGRASIGTRSTSLSSAWAATSAMSWCRSSEGRAMPPQFFACPCRSREKCRGTDRILATATTTIPGRSEPSKRTAESSRTSSLGRTSTSRNAAIGLT